MSHAATLIEAYSRRFDAYRTLEQALDTADEPAARTAAHQADQDAEAARAAADAVAHPLVLNILAYHQVTAPPPEIADLVNTMHDRTFSRLAELADARNYSNNLLLALRRAWRRYHERPEGSAGKLDYEAIYRVFHCSTFGEVAFILEEEWSATDAEVVQCRRFWRAANYRGDVPDPVTPGEDDPLTPPPWPVGTYICVLERAPSGEEAERQTRADPAICGAVLSEKSAISMGDEGIWNGRRQLEAEWMDWRERKQDVEKKTLEKDCEEDYLKLVSYGDGVDGAIDRWLYASAI
ncbi:hypothetical protein C8R44DRAFT_904626 [Mycena epipterygia]|nr:hypothetical protein C8R44DRAFT_904626 [Mycena epipterygia]